MSKQELLEKLYEEYKDEFNGKEIVLGEGNVEADILLVGEAPGSEEVKLLRPFVGTAGKNLNEFLFLLGVERHNIYITNAIKFRLSKLNSETGRIINRPALKEEIKLNRKYFIKEVTIIKPKVIVTLGNVPLKSVTDNSFINIGQVHGEMNRIIIEENEYGLFPLYHPASIIYNRRLKEVYNSDIKKLKDLLNIDNIL